MTYVAQFLHKYPEPKSTGPDAVAAAQQEYSELVDWLMKKTQYMEHLQQTKTLPISYEAYLSFKDEVDEKGIIYEKLRQLFESQSMIAITPDAWKEVQRLWMKLESQLRYWLWLLDSKLPGDFKIVGEWLAKAEQLIYNDEVPTIMNEETASIISRKLEEHKAFFAEYPTIMEKFQQACNKDYVNEVPRAQLTNMAYRLKEIGPKATERRIRLKFLEHKVSCVTYYLTLSNMHVFCKHFHP